MDRDAAERALAEAFRLAHGEPATLDFAWWTPERARKAARRTFARLDADGMPRLVAKIPLSTSDGKVQHEYGVLAGLAAGVPTPRPAALRPLGRGFVMSYVPGTDLPDLLAARVDAGLWRAVLWPVIDLMAGLHLAEAEGGRHPVLPAWDVARQYVAAPVNDPPRLADAVADARTGPTHGDLGPWNVRVDVATDAVAAIDWEDYRPVGICGIDLLNLLLTIGLVAFPSYRDRGYDWLYDQILHSEHWMPGLVRDGVRHYARCVDHDPSKVLDLLPFFCQWLVTRIEAEGRDASGLFYGTFLRRYRSEPEGWVRDFVGD